MKNKILIINGPNLNLLGIREKQIYGDMTYQTLCAELKKYQADTIDLEIYQSNHEGDLIDKIQQAYFDKVEGIIINPGAYTHTSIGILDALRSVNLPTVEVHLSNIFEREEYRHVDYIYDYCYDHYIGEGTKGYFLAVMSLIHKLNN